MWGQERDFPPASWGRRIIPTRVGTSCHKPYRYVHGEDHPHACGDKEEKEKLEQSSLGSSPRVWGQELDINRPPNIVGIIPTRVGTSDKLKLVLLTHRIIPTRVGTSQSRAKKETYRQDHPHACGDKKIDSVDSLIASGSSPRVWGQVLTDGEGNAKHRIIPTRVGTSVQRVDQYADDKDHPHACGDKHKTSAR